MSTVLRLAGNGVDPGRALWLWCPGCDDAHRITVDAPNSWVWDGNGMAPTITPSIAVSSHKTFDADHHIIDTPRCHSFVHAGRWQFLSDSTHALAGQTVPVVPLPDWLNDEYVQ